MKERILDIVKTLGYDMNDRNVARICVEFSNFLDSIESKLEDGRAKENAYDRLYEAFRWALRGVKK